MSDKKFLTISQVAAITFGAGRALTETTINSDVDRENVTYADMSMNDKVDLNAKVADRLNGGKSSSDANGDENLTAAGDALFDGIVKALKPFTNTDDVAQ